MKQRRFLVATAMLTLALGLFMVMADAAFAQSGGSAGNFSCSGNQAVGSLYQVSASCPTTLRFDNIFSFLVCNIEQLSTNLLGNIFCGMITNLAPAVGAVIVLAVVFFGIGFTIGVIPATAREFQMFLFKVSAVWVFATQSDYLIGVAYAFFINGVRDGVAIALTGYSPSGAGTGPLVYQKLDSVLSTLIHYATDYISHTKVNIGERCKNAVFAVLAIMGIAFPPLFLLAVGLIAKLVMTFVRAVFGYVYALVGIAFLMTLAPFFLSFFLFKQTRPFFDKWVGYLASFALQIVVLFAFLSFILSIDVSSMTSSFTGTANDPGLIMPAQETPETTSFRAPWDYCTLCKFEIVDKVKGTPIDPAKDRSAFSNGKPQCIKDKNGQRIPINVLTASAPEANTQANKLQQSVMFKFAGGALLSLFVLAYVVQMLLDYVAALAQSIAGNFGGAGYAPQLGGGQTIGRRAGVQMPGEGLIGDMERGFDRGYRGAGGTSIQATAAGFKQSAKTLLEGDGPMRRADNSMENTGMRGRFLDWLVDPNHMSES